MDEGSAWCLLNAISDISHDEPPIRLPLNSGCALARQLKRTWQRMNFVTRLIEAVAAFHRRKAEREIARFIFRRGSRITDRREREIERRRL
jgi:hypothetical protein